MKVFYAVQISNTTVRDGKPAWLIRNDACMNIAVGIIKSVIDVDNSFEFLLKCPPPEKCADLNHLSELFDNDPKYLSNVSFYIEDVPISPVTSRFNFNMAYHMDRSNILSTCDVMINDENTLTKNWRCLFENLNIQMGIVSTNYFLDSPVANKVPKNIRYYERQMESFISSDIAAFQCEAGRVEAMEAFNLLYKDSSIISKQSVWGVGAHAKEIRKYSSVPKMTTPTIYFGNRITESVERYTNWDSFAAAIGLVANKYKRPFNAIMLNPTRKISHSTTDEINKLSNNKVTILDNNEKFTREDYLKFINSAHISCNLFVTEVHGGVTHCEALLAENLVIMPKVNNYYHKFKLDKSDDKYPFFIGLDPDNKNKPNINDLAEAIISALDMYYDNKNSFARWTSECGRIGYTYESYEMAANRIIKDLQSLTNKINTLVE